MLKLPAYVLEYSNGRLPNGFGSRRKHWKAEEFQKFPAAEIVFRGIVEDSTYNIIQMGARITEMVFNFRDGWSKDMLDIFESLVKRYVVIHASIVMDLSFPKRSLKLGE